MASRHRFLADLSQCLFDFVIQLLPPEDELHVKENVRVLLERLIRTIEPNSRLLAFGSTANGFSLRNSDMDLCCLIDSGERLNASDLVTMLGDVLERETRFHVKPLPHARIPIVKLSLDPSPGLPSGIACDIGFENRLAIENTRLLFTYAKIDPTRVRTLVLFLKIWSKRRKINSPYKGTLSSYGYVLLVIYFLVHVKNPPVLPNLQQMPPLRPINKDETTLNRYNVWFFDDTDILCQRWQSENTETVAELLIDFFRYFSRDFLYNTGVASIRAGLLKKEAKGWQNDLSASARYDSSRERNRFCIEDPFETDYNVARCVTKDGLYTIRGEFMRASRILATRPERAVIALAELCEERKDEDLVSAPSHVTRHPAGGARLGIPPQTPYSVGSQSRSRPRNDFGSVTEDTKGTMTGDTNEITSDTESTVLPSQIQTLSPSQSHTSDFSHHPPLSSSTTAATNIPISIFLHPMPDHIHPEHMAPKRSKWTSPPPPDAPSVDRTLYESQLDKSLELGTASTEAREDPRRSYKRDDGVEGDNNRWEEGSEVSSDIGSVVESLSEVGSVRSFTEGVYFASPNPSGGNAVPIRRPSWHVADSLPRGWVPPSFTPANALKLPQLQTQNGGRGRFARQYASEHQESHGIPPSSSPVAVSVGTPSPPTSFRTPSFHNHNHNYNVGSGTSSPRSEYTRPPRPYHHHHHTQQRQGGGSGFNTPQQQQGWSISHQMNSPLVPGSPELLSPSSFDSHHSHSHTHPPRINSSSSPRIAGISQSPRFLNNNHGHASPRLTLDMNMESSAPTTTTVYYQTTVPKSPRVAVPYHGHTQPGGSGIGSATTSPGGGAGGGTSTSPSFAAYQNSGTGGGVGEDILPPNLPAIGIMRGFDAGLANRIAILSGCAGVLGLGPPLGPLTTTMPEASASTPTPGMFRGERGEEGDGVRMAMRHGHSVSNRTVVGLMPLVGVMKEEEAEGKVSRSRSGSPVKSPVPTMPNGLHGVITLEKNEQRTKSGNEELTPVQVVVSSSSLMCEEASTPVGGSGSDIRGSVSTMSSSIPSGSASTTTTSTSTSSAGSNSTAPTRASSAKSKSRSPSPLVPPTTNASASTGPAFVPLKITKEEEERFHATAGSAVIGGKVVDGDQNKADAPAAAAGSGNTVEEVKSREIERKVEVKGGANGNGNGKATAKTNGGGAGGMKGNGGSSKTKGKQKGKQKRNGSGVSGNRKFDQAVEASGKAVTAAAAVTAAVAGGGGGASS